MGCVSPSDRRVKPPSPVPSPNLRILALLCVAMAGVAAPAIAMLMLGHGAVSAPLARVSGALLAVGMMGAGMIGAAATGRFWVGVVLAMLAGTGLVALAFALGVPPLAHPLSLAIALILASFSFAARGALFARSAADKGWLIAVLVVAGEAAMLFTAAAMPKALPDWLLVLLPAQWASTAIGAALHGMDAWAAGAALMALLGTGAATMLVAGLWPRRWPYLVMFTAWLGFSALVWHHPAPPLPVLESAAIP